MRFRALVGLVQIVGDDAVSWSGPNSTFQSSHQFPTWN
jgi:hypothetical protein